MGDAASTRDKIIEAAVGCMREHGVRSTTTKMVARQAGVSEGSIYNHFTNRANLIVAAFMAATADIRYSAETLQNSAGIGSVEENLTGTMSEIIRFFRRIAPIAGSIIGDPELRSWFTNGQVAAPDGSLLSPANGIVGVSAYLERERAIGRIPTETPLRITASMLIGACLQYVFMEQLSTGRGPDSGDMLLPEAEDYARQAVRALLRDR